MTFDHIENAIAAIGRGEVVIVVDDEDRENEGDLIVAAEKITAGDDGLHGPAHERRHLHADDG